MKTTCPPVESIADLLELPHHDPRRAHLDACPRCRARAAAFVSFMSASDIPGADPGKAQAHLGDVLDAAIGHPPSATRASSRPREGTSVSRFRRWLAALGAPALRPVFAAAALLVTAGVIWFAQPSREADRVLRGPVGGAAMASPEGLEARPVGSDVWLTWRSVAGADGYEIVIYAPDLSVLARLGPMADTTVAVSAENLSAVAPGTTLSWKVVVLEQGDAAGDSPLRQFRRP